MLEEESSSESSLRRRVEEFTSTFRPQDTPSAYELLFLPAEEDTGFEPTPSELRRCMRQWATLLEDIEGPEDLVGANWVEAAELTLAYLVCAGRAGINPEEDEAFHRIVTLTRRVERELRAAVDAPESAGNETVERISAVAEEIVAQGLAAEPSP